MSPRAVHIAWVTSALLYLAVATAAADPLLADAIKAGDRQSALEMLKTGADVNAAQPDGSTPLHWAVYRDDIDLVRGEGQRRESSGLDAARGGCEGLQPRSRRPVAQGGR
jgi:hypothetical protein